MLNETDRQILMESSVELARHGHKQHAAAIASLLTRASAATVAEPSDVPQLHVGDSSFEGWYQDYAARLTGNPKQTARDAYAAGMGDPLVMPREAAQQQAEPDAANEIACSSCGLTMDDSKALAAIKQAEPGADEGDGCPELPTPFISVWAGSDAEDCRLDVCYTPSAPRSDGAYATKLYTAEQMRTYARTAQSGQRAGVAITPAVLEAVAGYYYDGPHRDTRIVNRLHEDALRLAAAPTQQKG